MAANTWENSVCSRLSTAMIPWPPAGMNSFSGSRSNENSGSESRPIRFNPAAARRIASYSPSRSLLSLVWIFPRKRAQRAFLISPICTWRRGLPVPTRNGPSGSGLPFTVTSTSPASSLGSAAAMTNPLASSSGMSLALWTAPSMRPSRRALSNSEINAPFPPNSTRGRSRIRSPLVTMGTSSAVSSGKARSMASAANLAWAMARGLFLVPRRITFFSLFNGRSLLSPSRSPGNNTRRPPGYPGPGQ